MPTPYYLNPKATKLPEGHDDTLDPAEEPTDSAVRVLAASTWPVHDTSPGPRGPRDRPAGHRPTDPARRSLPPFEWPRFANLIGLPEPDLDPDIALWPVDIVNRWPFTGPPTTGVWPKGWFGIDNAAVPWVCTVGGQPGTWESIGTGVTLPPSNGVDDTVVIQNAINAISAALAGTGAIGTVRGDPGSIYQLPNQAVNTILCDVQTVACSLVLSSNVRLEQINFNQTPIKTTAHHATIGIANGTQLCAVNECTFFGGAVVPDSSNEWPNFAIEAGHVTDVWVTNNRATNYWTGMMLVLGDNSGTTPARWTVDHNYMDQMQASFIKFDGGGIDIKIINNYFGRYLSLPWAGETILNNNATGQNIRFEICDNHISNGLIFLPSATDSVIARNLITNSIPSGAGIQPYGIQCWLAQNVEITDNVIDLSNANAGAATPYGGGAIFATNSSTTPASGFVIARNVIRSNALLSAYIMANQTGAGTTSNDIAVVDNSCFGAYPSVGINVANWNFPTVSGNMVSFIPTNPTGNAWSILASPCARSRIMDNYAVNGGILLGPAASGPSFATVVGNTLEIAVSNTYGIRAQVNSLITNNRVVSTATTALLGGGILLLTAGIRCSILNNFVDFSGTTANTNCIQENVNTTSLIANNNLIPAGTGLGVSLFAGSASIARHNVGFNPRGNQTLTITASPMSIAASQTDRTIYFSTSTGTTTVAIAGGPTITLQPSATGQGIFIPAQVAATLTYAAAPTALVEAY